LRAKHRPGHHPRHPARGRHRRDRRLRRLGPARGRPAVRPGSLRAHPLPRHHRPRHHDHPPVRRHTMAPSTRIKGRQLSLKIGTPAVDVWADTTSVVLDREEAEDDVVTFHDASQPGGAMQEFLQITAIQSTDPDSLWSYIWEHTGEEIPFTYAPH